MDSTQYFGPAQGFAEQMAAAEAGIRRERRSLPAHDLNGVRRRDWAKAVLGAEIKHAIDDFWRVAFDQRIGLLFDRYRWQSEPLPYRFDHEVRAAEAWAALGELQMHEGDRYGWWQLWTGWNEQQRAQWKAGWWRRARQFVKTMRRYREARAGVDQPVARAA